MGGCHAPDVQTVCCALDVHCRNFIPGGAKLAIGHFNRRKRSLVVEGEGKLGLLWSGWILHDNVQAVQ